MNTDIAWERWGKSDPYFGVLSIPQFRGATSASASGFFESGDTFIRDQLSAALASFGEFPMDRALDFGSGVGRLLIPLSRTFSSVVGVDISEAMRAECQKNLEIRGIRNAALVRSDDDLSEAHGSFSFVNSYIVLQHIPARRGYKIIDRLLSAVAPRGIISLQFTVNRGDHPLQAALYWAQRYIPGVQILTNMAKGRSLLEPLVEMNEYDLARVIHQFESAGMSTPVIEWEKQGRVQGVRILAQRERG